MNYDYLIHHACYNLDHPEGKSRSVQNPLYRLETQIAKRYPGESLGSIPRANKERSGLGSDNFDDNAFKLVIT